jgi:nucleoid DNA-binding protein
MSSLSAEDVIDAFVDVVRDRLETGDTVEVPSLGTFAVEHRQSEVEEEDDTRRLTPPRNEVIFDPEQE